MANARYNNTMMKTATCCCQLSKKLLQQPTRNLNRDVNIFLGNSWFASVNACVNMKKQNKCEFIGIIKTNPSKFPKTYLEQTIALWPAGSHLVLEATINNVDLVAIGYKYNGQKTQCFVATQSAGHTKNGVSYLAKWKDKHHNTCAQYIPWPEIVSKYYQHCNTINVHNQMRQLELKLEKMWPTQCSFF